jgi:hypothetical protein
LAYDPAPSRIANVNKHRKLPASVVFLSIGAYAFVMKQEDTAGRPLITTGTAGR